MYVSQQEACKVFGVVTSTLRRWDKQNKIKTISARNILLKELADYESKNYSKFIIDKF